MFRQSFALAAPPPSTPVIGLFFSTTSCCYFKPSDKRLLRNRGYMARQLTVFTVRSAAAENLDGGSCVITLCDSPVDSTIFAGSSFANRTACNLPWNGAAQFTHNLYRQPKGHGNQLSAWLGFHNAPEDVMLGIPEKSLANAEAITAATVTSDRHRPIYHEAAGPRINRILINPPPVNERSTEVYV